MPLGPLNLSDADMKGFDPLEPRQYDAEVFEITMDSVKNEGKVPIGTPLMKVQYRITDPEFENRRVFNQYVIPPKGHDKAKKAKMEGMIARFFIALGDSEETVLSKGFEPDLEDYKGRPCVVTVGKEQKRDRENNVVEGEWNNPVKAVKPAGTAVASGGLL